MDFQGPNLKSCAVQPAVTNVGENHVLIGLNCNDLILRKLDGSDKAYSGA
jgi:hypothetical protein